MADWNSPATWEQAYSVRGGLPDKQDSELPIGAGFGEQLSYLDGRKYALQLSDDGETGLSHFRFRLQKLGASGAFTPSVNTLIVGCGFGWLVEAIVDLGSNAVWGTDISTLIQASIADPGVAVRADIQPLILNVNILDANAAQQFKNAGAGNNSGKFSNVVTEHVLEDWPIGDMATILDACDALLAPGQSNVFHLVAASDAVGSDQFDPQIVVNQLTLAEWVSIRPSHFWIDEVTGTVGGNQ
jgi:hypothetical protein